MELNFFFKVYIFKLQKQNVYCKNHYIQTDLFHQKFSRITSLAAVTHNKIPRSYPTIPDDISVQRSEKLATEALTTRTDGRTDGRTASFSFKMQVKINAVISNFVWMKSLLIYQITCLKISKLQSDP